MNTFKFVDHFKELDTIVSKPVVLSTVSHPIVSIAIPTYNRGRLIKDALESALNQDFDYDYEVVIIDNNDDRNSETCRYVTSVKDPRVSFFQNSPNAGMVGNHNLCFKLCRADYVVILHDDDILLPFALKVYMKTIYTFPEAGMISSKDYNMINNVKPNITIPTKVHVRKQKLLYNFVRFSVEEPSGTFYNKSKMIEIGGYNKDFYPCFDYSGAVMMISKHPVYTITEKLLIYRYEDNESLNPRTNINSLIMDYYIVRDIGYKIGVPRWIVNIVQELRTRNRLWLSKLNGGQDRIILEGKIYKAGNRMTAIVALLLNKIVDAIFYCNVPKTIHLY